MCRCMRAGGISYSPATISGPESRRKPMAGCGREGACRLRSCHRLGAARCRRGPRLALSRRRERHAGRALGRPRDCKPSHVRGGCLLRRSGRSVARRCRSARGFHRGGSCARISGARRQSADRTGRPRGADRKAWRGRARQRRGLCDEGSRAAGRAVRSSGVERGWQARCPRRKSCAACCIISDPIWPGRISLDGVSLGDTWRHPAIRRNDETNGLIPFHKLSQWLTYSLVEPLQEGGVQGRRSRWAYRACGISQWRAVRRCRRDRAARSGGGRAQGMSRAPNWWWNGAR